MAAGVQKRREDERIRKLTDRWDEVMKPVGEPPKGFRDWYEHNGFDGSNFIYYKARCEDRVLHILPENGTA